MWDEPAATATALGSDCTGVGARTSGPNVPLPTWPFALSPQQSTPPSAMRAHVWAYPAITAFTLASAGMSAIT